MTRLEILKNSLEKKQAKFNEKLNEHFMEVRRANGQPLNDKRNGGGQHLGDGSDKITHLQQCRQRLKRLQPQ